MLGRRRRRREVEREARRERRRGAVVVGVGVGEGGERMDGIEGFVGGERLGLAGMERGTVGVG